MVLGSFLPYYNYDKAPLYSLEISFSSLWTSKISVSCFYSKEASMLSAIVFILVGCTTDLLIFLFLIYDVIAAVIL